MVKGIFLLRSTDMLPDPRVEKYVMFYKKHNLCYTLLGWNRASEEQYKENTVFFNYEAQYGAGVSNMKGLIKYNFFLWKQLLKNRHTYHFIHACDLDTVLPAIGVGLLFNKKIIFDVFDWYSHSRVINNKVLLFFIKCCECISVKTSDKIIICDRERISQIPYKISRRKVIVLPNIPHFENINFEYKKEENYKLTISYVGILGVARGLEDMLEVVSEMPEIKFVIGGFGELEPIVSEYSHKFSNIIFLGKLDYRESLSVMAASDVICALYYKIIKNHIYAAPNKYYEGLYLGRPIITNEDTILGEKTRKERTGFVIQENIQNIRELLKCLGREQTEMYGKNAAMLWNNVYKNLWQDTIEKDYGEFLEGSR